MKVELEDKTHGSAENVSIEFVERGGDFESKIIVAFSGNKFGIGAEDLLRAIKFLKGDLK